MNSREYKEQAEEAAAHQVKTTKAMLSITQDRLVDEPGFPANKARHGKHQGALPESLDEVCVEQAEAKPSEAGKDAIAEGHNRQDLHIVLEQGLGVGLGDGKNGG